MQSLAIRLSSMQSLARSSNFCYEKIKMICVERKMAYAKRYA